MSQSRHPVALDLERRVGGATRLLVVVMALPLVDGIFPALVLAGALDTVGGVVQVGLLVFGGSATVAVVLAELDGPPREQVRTIGLVGIGLVALAAIEAALAPTIAGLIDLATFEWFAALVLIAVAAQTASARVGELLPRPAVIVGIGLLASVELSGASLIIDLDVTLVVRAVAAAGVGVVFAAAVAGAGPALREVVDLDRFRFGSAVALGTLPLSLLGVVPGNAPLAVLAVSALLAFDSSGGTPKETTAATDGGSSESDESRPPWL